MLLQFRMLSDEDDNFLRDYLLPPEMTLADLHAFISDDLKYEKENMTSFFTSDREWNRLSEYTYLDLGLGEDEGVEGTSVPGAMSDMTLADVIRQNHNRLIYQFDAVGDRAFYLELVDARRDEEASPVNRSIFDEIMSDFDDFDGNESYADDE